MAPWAKTSRSVSYTHLADLVVKYTYVDEGPTLKRIRPRAKGSASRILKRTSHITVVVAPGKEA